MSSQIKIPSKRPPIDLPSKVSPRQRGILLLDLSSKSILITVSKKKAGPRAISARRRPRSPAGFRLQSSRRRPPPSRPSRRRDVNFLEGAEETSENWKEADKSLGGFDCSPSRESFSGRRRRRRWRVPSRAEPPPDRRREGEGKMRASLTEAETRFCHEKVGVARLSRNEGRQERDVPFGHFCRRRRGSLVERGREGPIPEATTTTTTTTSSSRNLWSDEKQASYGRIKKT